MKNDLKKVSYVPGSYNPGSLTPAAKTALIDDLLQLGAGDDTTAPVEDVVDQFGVAKTDPTFLQDLYATLSVEHKDPRKRNMILHDTCNAIKENELHGHISAITKKEETLYHTLQEVKKYIGQYYEMIFKYVESEAIKPEDKQEHMIENLFNWEDPLFGVSLFLYQKELNSTEKFLRNIRQETGQKRKLARLLLDDVTLAATNNEKKFQKIIKDFFLLLDRDAIHIEQYNPFKEGYTHINPDIAEQLGFDLQKEVDWKVKLADILNKEHSPFERFFASTRDYAKKICSDAEVMGKIRKNLRSMAAKFNTKVLNPLHNQKDVVIQITMLQEYVSKNRKKGFSRSQFAKFKKDNDITINQYDKYLELPVPQYSDLYKALEGDKKIILAEKGLQDLLSQELQFTQTMTWFGNNTYAPHFVKNINLAGQNLGIPRTGTLKGRLDKICGTLKDMREIFIFVAPSMDMNIKLLDNGKNITPEKSKDELDISIEEATDKLFDSFLNDE